MHSGFKEKVLRIELMLIKVPNLMIFLKRKVFIFVEWN